VELDKVLYKVGKGWTKTKRIVMFELVTTKRA